MRGWLDRTVDRVDGFLGAMGALAGELLRLAGLTALRAATFSVDGPRLLAELDRAVVGALPLVAATGFATGAVMVWQTVEGLARFGASAYAAKIVALSLVRELSPVLVGLLLAGRAGSAMAAELGSMAITEQLTAMRALALDWHRYLVAPRVLALALGLPCLVLVFDAAGLAGGFAVGVLDRGIPSGAYLTATREALLARDLGCGLVKGCVFGLLIGLVGCRMGLATDPKRGAGAVGWSTTAAVVTASALVLLANAVITKVYLGGAG
jgi:phospholipid/cholesterol/gamma-HCH transport system permease protein